MALLPRIRHRAQRRGGRAREVVPSHVFCGEGDGVFCDDGFACRGMCCNEHRVTVLEMVYCFFLKVVQFEGVLLLDI